VSEVLVVNASPLIFLGNANRIDLLRAVGATRVVVPEAVYAEVTRAGHGDGAAASLAGSTWIERLHEPAVPTSVVAWNLGPGESAVIAAALSMRAARAVIDDRQGRRCAQALDVEVTGTLGVVVAAHRRGHVEDPRALLMELRVAGMWLSDNVISQALAIAGVKT
jgi:predicted nucleic acid-binding protein